MKKRLPFPGSMTSQSAVPILYNALTSYTLLNQGTYDNTDLALHSYYIVYLLWTV